MSESSSMPMVPSMMSDGEEEEKEEEEMGYSANQGTMTNADFRRMVMKSKQSASSEKTESGSVSQSVDDLQTREDAAMRRRKRKSMYAKLKRVEEERDAELAKKYRDRAQERREKSVKDEDPADAARATSGYRAVDPNASQTMEEQRRQAMQESKFLGGDMEHTHLVKGLDYALLQKVRSDMTVQPMPAEMDTQAPVESSRQSAPAQAAAPAQPAAPSQQASLEFKTKLGKNIHKAVFQRALPAKNELFLPGRMCYAVQLDDEYTENDVPTTIIRSKADCPNVQSTVMTTNDIVIHKLTQVLSYLRGSRHDRKKMKRKDKGGEDRPMGKLPGASDPIFADLDSNYQSLPRDKDSAAKQAPSLPKFGNYFGSAQQQQQQQSEEQSKKEHMMGGLSKEQLAAGWAVADLARLQEPSTAAGAAPTAMARPEQPAAPGAAVGTAAAAAAPESAEAAQAASLKRTMQKEAISDSYMECYPGVGDDDGGYDSEEDADFSKMDRGAKKGPLKRWDFENEQEYAAYMDSREAMPKAAFQYGVKMNAGRKTRRFGKGGEKDEKAKIDREWKKISNMLDKRQGSGQRDGAPAAKRAR